MKAVVLGFGRSGKAANAVLAARGRLRQLRAARERSRRLVTQQLAGETVTATKAVDASGSTEFTKAAASRFYRLSATMTE